MRENRGFKKGSFRGPADCSLLTMKKSLLFAALTGVMLGAILAGCAKKKEADAATPSPAPSPAPTPVAPRKDTVVLVDAAERSRHFAAVHRQLELGGTMYGYVDVDGDVEKLAVGLQGFAENLAQTQPEVAPFLKQDFSALFAELGLGDIKAVGLSSVPEGDGYFRNRVFFHTPGGRRGLLAGLGGKPAAFTKARLAPADVDFYSEAETDLGQVYKTAKAIVAKVGGEPSSSLMEEKIRAAGEMASIPLLSFLNDWKGSTALIVRLDPEKNLRLPQLVIPQPSLLICGDGLASVVEPLLQKSPMLKATKEGDRRTYALAQPLPIPGIDPVFVLDGNTLYFASSRAFMDECLNQQAGLDQSPEFQDALRQVGAEGNGLVYASPRLFARLHELEKLNPQLPPDEKRVLQLVMSNVPKPPRPLISARTNLDDGILVKAHWNRSLKQDVAMMAVYNPVTVGVLAAMAIPAFQKVRHASQEKAIMNNLRQLAAAADQYCLEQGVDTCTFEQIVGPDKYVKTIQSVAGEEYGHLRFKVGYGVAVYTADGLQVRYPPELPLLEEEEGRPEAEGGVEVPQAESAAPVPQ